MVHVSESKQNQISTIRNERSTSTSADILTALLDLPDEIIQKVMVYISHEDPFSLAIFMEGHLQNTTYKRWMDCCQRALLLGTIPAVRTNPTKLPGLLCRASETGDLEKVKQIFKFVDQEKISGNEMDVKMNIHGISWGPLQSESARMSNPRLVDTSSGVDGKTPLILAAENGHIDVCEYLITYQMANLNANDNNHYSALIHASLNNQIEVTKVLVNHSVNINYQGAYTAARLATQKGHLEVVKILEEKILYWMLDMALLV